MMCGDAARCQVNLAKETGGEYCWLSSVGPNDPLSKAGLLVGDSLLALDRRSFFQASQQAVLEVRRSPSARLWACSDPGLSIVVRRLR